MQASMQASSNASINACVRASKQASKQQRMRARMQAIPHTSAQCKYPRMSSTRCLSAYGGSNSAQRVKPRAERAEERLDRRLLCLRPPIQRRRQYLPVVQCVAFKFSLCITHSRSSESLFTLIPHHAIGQT
jgi:hypothetical protein